ncbi:MAG TPA: SH3 domain-containing protein [Methyloceanibacter sp.]|nr:SH3 domain-containing protein [Methyloceanibacter sp.]
MGPIGKIGMDRLSPSLWLVGAVLYAAATLLLTQPFFDRGSASLAATHETIVAKRVEPASPKLLALAPVSPGELEPAQTSNVSWPHNEWVEIVGYTAVVRADPSASSRVLTAYPVGHALRVIERDGDFARIQDLSSGHLGWVAASSIAAFVPGYREREDPIAPRPLVAVAQTQTPAVLPKVSRPSQGAVPPRPRQETVAVTEPAEAMPLLTRASTAPRRLAENQADGGVAALVQRAFSGH